MTFPPLPIRFDPLFRRKPWGGRRLSTLLGKALPGTGPIVESWELVSLAGAESLVRDEPLAGSSLGELTRDWGTDLLGQARLVDGRFPLLIKYLDARENLSVQVHPKPAADDPGGARGGVKHECWYVVHAEPGAKLYVGLKAGVTAADVAGAMNTPALVGLLRDWEGRAGECYYLPSGTLHALGAGLVVAEVQTPSDITYRAYDWGRVDEAGKARELHVTESVANIRYDVGADEIRPAARPIVGGVGAGRRLMACERFAVDHYTAAGLQGYPLQPGTMRIWMVLRGAGCLTRTRDPHTFRCPFQTGDTVLIPAECGDTRLDLAGPAEWLEASVP